MKVKLDENLGRRCAQLFREAGHDVATVHEQDLCGAADPEVARRCTAEGRCLVTLDVDFANPFLFDPRLHAGIAVLRVPRYASHEGLLALVRTLLAGVERSDIAGRLWIIEQERIREYQPVDE